MNTIGILGGMGPEATVDIFNKIIKNTPAAVDQDHLPIIINNNPKIPDRSAAFLGKGKSPVPDLVEGCRVLERAGADFIIIPCVSAHIFLEEILAKINLPIISIFDAVATTIEREFPHIKTIGLIATDGTVKAKYFQKRLNDYGFKVIIPEMNLQREIMEDIYKIKNTDSTHSRAEIRSRLILASESLVNRKSNPAQGIIAGCTEIPVVLRQEDISVPFFDSLLILAKEAIKMAQEQ